MSLKKALSIKLPKFKAPYDTLKFVFVLKMIFLHVFARCGFTRRLEEEVEGSFVGSNADIVLEMCEGVPLSLSLCHSERERVRVRGDETTMDIRLSERESKCSSKRVVCLRR